MSSGRRTRISTKYGANATDEFEPGSRRRVLKNLLGITSLREIQRKESEAYRDAERLIIETFRKDQTLTTTDIHSIHRMFLGTIYSWAGTPRSVNITKADFLFTAAFALPAALDTFENEILSANTPCAGKTLEEISMKIAIVHAEFLLLHPYREGNGRTARLLATFMAYQAGLPGMDFGFVGNRGKEFDQYIAAVHAAMDRRYERMQKIVLRALRRALGRPGAETVA